MEASPSKISSSAIMERLDAIAASVAPLVLRGSPRPLLVYKPNPRDVTKGVAAKFSFRTVPTTNEKKYTNYSSSFFAEIVPQVPNTGEFAKFGWRNEEGTDAHPEAVSAKLGLPDLSALLLAFREYRILGRGVPVGIRPITRVDGKFVPSQDDNAVGLIHKFEGTVKTIKWTFSPDRSILEIAKGRDQRKSISLSLQEEIQLTTFFQLGLETLLISD